MKRILAAASSLALAMTCACVPIDSARADVIFELANQYEFIDNAFTMESRNNVQGELESISSGWSWKSSYNGTNKPHIVYNRGYYDGAYPLDATVLYRKIGAVDGRWVDARVRYSNPGIWSEPYYASSTHCYTSTCIELKAFWTGCTYFCTNHLDLEFSLFWNDSGEPLAMNDVWVTFGSLNTGEAVRYNASGNIKSTVLKSNNLKQIANGHWKGISNDFQDSVGSGTFARNAVSFHSITPTMSMSMISDGGAMWMFPLFTPLASVRPPDPMKTSEVVN